MAGEGSEGRVYTEAEYKAGISAAVKRRLEKFSDYEDLKARAARLDEQAQVASKLQEKVDSLTEQQSGYKARDERAKLLAKVSQRTGVDVSKLEALNGSDEDTLVRQAEALFPRYEPTREGNPPGAATDSAEREMVRALFGTNS